MSAGMPMSWFSNRNIFITALRAASMAMHKPIYFLRLLTIMMVVLAIMKGGDQQDEDEEEWIHP